MRAPALLCLAVLLASGCAAVPYKYGSGIESAKTTPLAPGEPQIERGRPRKFIDGFGHYVAALPSKLMLWNWKIENHNISPETEEKLKRYLEENDLKNVKVRLNQYSPGSEWRRLFRNKAVGAGWRYTLGVISVAMYTSFPGRFFGSLLPWSAGDHYNPYTNTIHLYSDHQATALHEGGHAKDFAPRRFKGTYSFLGAIPLVPLYHEGRATNDVLGYYRDKALIADEKNGIKVLYPAYCTYVAGEGLKWPSMFLVLPSWLGYAVSGGLVIPAHIVARIRAKRMQEPPPAAAPAPVPVSAAVPAPVPAPAAEVPPVP
ncbi:MAG: hypothetical protein A2X36_03095 [Elusimicrobia bacterium GWA2_69_24]|nr:MAG: hypothetical protein A2X36_03095 [Elusimicrobia bacterium GWA2_69_24]HBL19225.1 hypothetical protein [Elusimicrobiota bacterium]